MRVAVFLLATYCFAGSCEAAQHAKLLVQLKGHSASEKALDDLNKAKAALEAAWEDACRNNCPVTLNLEAW